MVYVLLLLTTMVTILFAYWVYLNIVMFKIRRRMTQRDKDYDALQADNGQRLLDALLSIESRYINAPMSTDIAEAFYAGRYITRDTAQLLLTGSGPLSEEVAAKIKTELERMNNTYGHSN